MDSPRFNEGIYPPSGIAVLHSYYTIREITIPVIITEETVVHKTGLFEIRGFDC